MSEKRETTWVKISNGSADCKCVRCKNRVRVGMARVTKKTWLRGEDERVYLCQGCTTHIESKARNEVLNKAVDALVNAGAKERA